MMHQQHFPEENQENQAFNGPSGWGAKQAKK
jgi:hypothetical protein